MYGCDLGGCVGGGWGGVFFFFNDTATTEIYTLSLHDALPISRSANTPFRREFGIQHVFPVTCHVGAMKVAETNEIGRAHV